MEDNFISIVSTYFAFSGETSAGNGEDSYIISINENKGLIGVFDGCGGIGSRRYQAYDSKTGAYIAARAAGESSAEWFDIYSRQAAAGGTAALSTALKNALELINSQAEESRIRGAMTHQFPTTLALTVIEARNGGLYADFIWAGDSRG